MVKKKKVAKTSMKDAINQIKQLAGDGSENKAACADEKGNLTM